MAADADVGQDQLACVVETATEGSATVAAVASISAATTNEWGPGEAGPASGTTAATTATAAADRLVVANRGVDQCQTAGVADRSAAGRAATAAAATWSAGSGIAVIGNAIAARWTVDTVQTLGLVGMNHAVANGEGAVVGDGTPLGRLAAGQCHAREQEAGASLDFE